MRYSVFLAALIAAVGCANPGDTAAPEAPAFTRTEVMVPVRDGVHLQTVILTPINQSGPLPILFTRTPYGVPDSAPHGMPPNPQASWAGRRLHLRPSEHPRPIQVRGRVHVVVAGRSH